MRRCSSCKKTGHTKRSCPVLLLPKAKKDQEKSIFVHVTKNAPSSPHVLTLKQKEPQNNWDKIPVFQEKKNLPKERVPVDFASMVRNANQNNKEQLSKKSAHHYFSSLSKVQKPVYLKKEKIRVESSKEADHLDQVVSVPKKISVSVRWSETFQDFISKSRSLFFNRRFWGAFVLIAVMVSLPYPAMAYYKKLKNTSSTIIERSTNGFLALQSSAVAAFHSDLGQAQQDLNRALQSFSDAESVLDGEHQIVQSLASFIPLLGNQIESRRHILSAGHHVALGNTYILKGISEVEEQKSMNLTDQFYNLREHFRFALPQYKQALNDLASVNDNVIPLEYQNSFQEFKVLFAAFVEDTENMIEFINTMEKVFGSEDFRRYLIVFQNNRELRATGGFMGSFAILDVQKGKILSLTVPPGGTYDLQGQLSERVKPPAPFLLVNDRWEFQDANWWPDFSASAKKMAWFYQHGRGATVDGVIAINATVFENLLSTLGPLTNEKHGVTLEAATALDDLQYKVEVDYDKASNTPKAIIGDLAFQLVEEFPKRTSEDVLKLLVVLHESLEQKEIQAYFTDSVAQQTIEKFGWSGQIAKTQSNQDYLMVVNSNIRGQKSDAKIKQEIEHQAEVQEDGSVIDTVVIRRSHTGTLGEIFSGAPNISYLRLYVPLGAEVVDAGGFSTIGDSAFRAPEQWATEDLDLLKIETARKFDAKTGMEVYKSFDKTVFGNWIVTNPGETSEVFITYRIPSLVSMNESTKTTPNKWQSAFFGSKSSQASRYSLVTQKQSGVESDFVSTVIYPTGWYPAWKSREEVDLALNGGIFETHLIKDEVYGIVMEK
jgi:hypothetical protein